MKSLGAWLAIGVTFLGCSSSSGTSGEDCGKVAPCGGDIVGTWKIVDSCADISSASLANSACPNETLSVNSISVSGSVTFTANMTYTVSASESASETLSVPMNCLSSGGVTVTCDDLATAANGLNKSDGGTTTMTTCTTSGSSCSCNITASGVSDDEMGTYTLSGNTFSTSPTAPAGATAGTGSYCVQGNTLHITSTMMAMGGAMGTPASDLVATKQ